MISRRPAVLLLLITGLAVFAAGAFAAPIDAASSTTWGADIDPTKVFFGDVNRFDPDRQEKVGTVRSAEFYEATEPVKTIRKENVKAGTARYNKLMREATTIFKKALENTAKGQSMVLIVEEGGISGYPVQDVTGEMIASL